MTKDEIIEMAKQADWPDSLIAPVIMAKLNDFAKLVAEHEREACAKVCDSLEEQCEKLFVPDEKWPTPSDCANIIRAMGQA